eukprot:Opistho-2@79359
MAEAQRQLGCPRPARFARFDPAEPLSVQVATFVALVCMLIGSVELVGGVGTVALRPFYVPSECLRNASLVVLNKAGGKTIACVGPRACSATNATYDAGNPDDTGRTDADDWEDLNSVPTSLFGDDKLVMPADGDANTLYGITQGGLYISRDNGISYMSALLWNCTEAAATVKCPVVNPTYSAPRPSNKTLQCSADGATTLSIVNQTSGALFMTWDTQEASTNIKYFLECDSLPTLDSGTAQITTMAFAGPSPTFVSGQYATVSAIGLTPTLPPAGVRSNYLREDYFIWWNTTVGDSGPLSGATVVEVDISSNNITSATHVCAAVLRELNRTKIAVNPAQGVTADNVIKASCEGASGAQLIIEQLTGGAVPSAALDRGSVGGMGATTTMATGSGLPGSVTPKSVTIEPTGTSTAAKGKPSGGSAIVNGIPTGAISEENWFFYNDKLSMGHYFYNYKNGGCVDENAVNASSVSVHRIDITHVDKFGLDQAKASIANAIASVANSIDGLSATVTNATVAGKRTYNFYTIARSRIVDGAQFFFVDSKGTIWTWYFDKTGSRTAPKTTPSNPAAGTFTRIDISDANGRSSAPEVAVVVRDAINAVPGVPFVATIPGGEFKSNRILVEGTDAEAPSTRGKVTISVIDTETAQVSIGAVIPLTTLNDIIIRLCIERDGGLDNTTSVGTCKKVTTVAGATIEVEFKTGATAAQNALAIVTALSTASNYPSGVIPFLAERYIDTSNRVYVVVWQASSGAMQPPRSMYDITVDNPTNTPKGALMTLVSQDGSYAPTVCAEGSGGVCPASSIKVTRNDAYIQVRSITASTVPSVALDVGHGFVENDLIVFIDTNDSGGVTSSKLAQRGFRIPFAAQKGSEILSLAPTVTTTSAGTTGRAYKAAPASACVTDVTANANSDGTFTKTSHGLSTNDVIYFTGEASSATNFANGKVCLVTVISVSTFKCGGGLTTASETSIVYCKIASASSLAVATVSSVSVGANATITSASGHDFQVGDIVTFPFPKNAAGTALATNAALWRHKFFRVSSVPSATTFTLSPSVTTTATATGLIYQSVVDATYTRPFTAHGLKRVMDAHSTFSLHFDTYIHDSANYNVVRVVSKKSGQVPALYQHNIGFYTVANPIHMKYQFFDVTNNNRGIQFCVEQTIIGPGGQCEPSTNATRAVVEVYLRLRLTSMTSGANPTITMMSSLHGILIDDLVVFLGVNGTGGSAVNQRAFKASTVTGATLKLLPSVTPSAASSTGFVYVSTSARYVAVSASASATNSTITAQPDTTNSGVTADNDVIYFPGVQGTGTSFSAGVVCVIASFSANDVNANTWTCKNGRAASGTNSNLDYYLISTASSKHDITATSTGTTSPIITLSDSLDANVGDLVVVELNSVAVGAPSAQFRNKIFRIFAMPSPTSVILDPPLSSSPNASSVGALWIVGVKAVSTNAANDQLYTTVSTAALYPGGVTAFSVGKMSSGAVFLQQRAVGVPVGRPLITVQVDTADNTRSGGTLTIFLQDTSAVSVCFDKSTSCPATSGQRIRADISGVSSEQEVAYILYKSLLDAVIPGIGDVTVESGVIVSVSIYLLPGALPQRPDLSGGTPSTSLCGSWFISKFESSLASVIGYHSAGAYVPPLYGIASAVAAPTSITNTHPDAGNNAWDMDSGLSDLSISFLLANNKQIEQLAYGTVDGDAMLMTIATQLTFTNPVVTITGDVAAPTTVFPKQGPLSVMKFTPSGFALHKANLSMISKASIAQGQAFTFWSILGGTKKYAVRFFTNPDTSLRPPGVRHEVPIDVTDDPDVPTLNQRLIAGLDPIPGISASLGKQRVEITCDNGTVTPHGLRMRFFSSATNQQFVVWMNKGGAAPTLPDGALGVNVTLSDGDTASTVASKLAAVTSADAAFSVVFVVAVRRPYNTVRFIQRVGGVVLGQARIGLVADKADYSSSPSIGSNVLHLFSLSTDYQICIKQLPDDCPLANSATRATLNCTVIANCDTAAEVKSLLAATISAFGSQFSVLTVGATLYISVVSPGRSSPAHFSWSLGSWSIVNMVDSGQSPRAASGTEFEGGNSNKEGIIVGPAESVGVWRYKQVHEGTDTVRIAQDFIAITANDAVTGGSTPTSVLTISTLLAGGNGDRAVGDGNIGRDALRSPYESDGRKVTKMEGVLEGFSSDLAASTMYCRLWGAAANADSLTGYTTPCMIGGVVSGALRSVETAASPPIRMYPPTVVFSASGSAVVTWVVPEAHGTFSSATTQVVFTRCSGGPGTCDDVTTCSTACPTKTTTQGAVGINIFGLGNDDAYYAFRVRTKHSGSAYGALSSPTYARYEPCPNAVGAGFVGDL